MDNFELYRMVQMEVDEEGEVVNVSPLHIGDFVEENVDAFRMSGNGAEYVLASCSKELSGHFLSIEEEVVEEVVLTDAWFFDENTALVCVFITLAMVLCVVSVHFYIYRRGRNRIYEIDQTAVAITSRSGQDHECFNIWTHDVHALEVLSRVASASHEAATALTTHRVTPQEARAMTLTISRASDFFEEVFEEGDDGDEDAGEGEGVHALQGVHPRDAEQRLFVQDFLRRASPLRLQTRLAGEVAAELGRARRNVLENLRTAVAMGNVSDAHLGSALCCLLDDKYGHLQLQETPTCQAARQFLDTRRDTEVDRARQEEAGAVENLLGHYHQSFSALSAHHQHGFITMSEQTQRIEQAESPQTDGGSAQSVGLAHITASTVSGGDYSHHLTVMHHVHTMRETSVRALAMRLRELETGEAAARESAGVRALAWQQELQRGLVKRLEQAGRPRRGAQGQGQAQGQGLVVRRDRLRDEHARQKARQNRWHQWFCYALLLCGGYLFCRGGAEGAAGREESTNIVEWTLFQARMVCVHINEDNEKKCAEDDVLEPDSSSRFHLSWHQEQEQEHGGGAAGAGAGAGEGRSGVFVTGGNALLQLSQLWAGAKGLAWLGVEAALARVLRLDPHWVAQTVLPCWFDLCAKLLPVWLLSYVMQCFGFASAGSVLVWLAALHRLRRPLELFLFHFRALGLLVLLPPCLQALLQLLDRRVSWHFYYACNSGGLAGRVSSVDTRPWLVYALFPICYLLLCHILGRHFYY